MKKSQGRVFLKEKALIKSGCPAPVSINFVPFLMRSAHLKQSSGRILGIKRIYKGGQEDWVKIKDFYFFSEDTVSYNCE